MSRLVKIQPVVGLAFATAMFAACVLSADENSLLQRRHVTVQGVGKIDAQPDIAVLTIDVTQEGPSLDKLSAEVRSRMTQILALIKKESVSEKDIQTTSYSIEPTLTYDKSGNSKRSGFRVGNRVQAKVRDLKKVGVLLSEVSDAGATSVEGPNFDFDHPQLLEQKALSMAMQNANEKAQLLATAAHAALGPVLIIDQAGGETVPVRPRFMQHMTMSAAVPAPEPIQSGEQTFSATVTATFALQ